METRAVLGCNQTGEILVKSPYMMKGYHKSCAPFIKTPFDAEGFLMSGDLGLLFGSKTNRDKIRVVSRLLRRRRLFIRDRPFE